MVAVPFLQEDNIIILSSITLEASAINFCPFIVTATWSIKMVWLCFSPEGWVSFWDCWDTLCHHGFIPGIFGVIHYLARISYYYDACKIVYCSLDDFFNMYYFIFWYKEEFFLLCLCFSCLCFEYQCWFTLSKSNVLCPYISIHFHRMI